MERQLLLLGLLMHANMHGYQLNETIEHSLGFFTNLKKPTLYYTLEKLEKQGYIRQETIREGSRPERRVYEITDTGRVKFFALLRQQLGTFDRTYYADDIAITFLDQLPPADAHALLTQKRVQAKTLIDDLRAAQNAHADSHYHMLTHTVAHLVAEVAWLDSILADLADQA